jgi:hypothetical protein
MEVSGKIDALVSLSLMKESSYPLGLVSPRAGMDMVEREESLLLPGTEPWLSSP